MSARSLLSLCISMASLSALAESSGPVELGAVSIVGSSQSIEQIAGSVHVIDSTDLEKFEYTDIQRVLASVPGVSFRNEDGYGLRPNISIRGTRDDRSGKITLMEDGVLIAPAPYSASSAYYFPSMGRISGVEVMKGASAIENGPYTIGGALNLLSTPIPYEQSGKVNIEYGEDNTSRAHGWVGDAKKNYGWLIEAQKMQSDGFDTIENADNDTGYDKEDIVAKFRVNTDRSSNVYQQLDLKLQYSTELSDQSYVGLTEADFASDPHQRYGLTQQDEMDNEHKEITLSYLLDFGQTQINTTGYFIEFKRDWFKVDKIGGDSISEVIDCANGGTCTDSDGVANNIASQDDAIAVLDGELAASVNIKHNNRSYESKGIQTQINHELTTGKIQHSIELGIRYHEDSEDRNQPTETWNQNDDGNLAYTSTAADSSPRFTSAKAWSAYISDDIAFGKIIMSPGVRIEDYKIEEEGDAANTTDQNVTLFGLGTTFQLNDSIALFAGIHEGHSPSLNKENSDPEEALNFELGSRYSNANLYSEATIFYSDYANLVGKCTSSSAVGNCDIGDTSNGGKATIQGLELLSKLSQKLNNGLSIPVSVTYTYTDATFDTSFSDNSGVWGAVTKDDRLPNLSDHQMQISLGLEALNTWGVDININYFSDTCSTAECNSGEEIDAYSVIDLAGRYQINPQTRIYANIDNLLDSEDVVARAPKNGARAQKPLTALMGVSYSF